MSNPKITPKNLSYDSSLPPFLQRMKGAYSGPSDGRHEREIARPKGARDPNADEDDAPTYVDEETNQPLSKEEYAALVKGDEADASTEDIQEQDNALSKETSKPAEKEKVASIGAARKRKVGKIVGGTDEDEEDSVGSKQQSTAALERKTDGETKKSDASKPKKKGKKIKLSFNDDEAS